MRDKLSNAAQGIAEFLPARERRLFDRLAEESAEVIVFGSRATEVHSKVSDLDIFCIGLSERFKSTRLDIVSRKPSEVEDLKWLGSELAGHIAAYGIVIRGRGDWRSATNLSEAAISRKERRVIALVDGLWTYWDRIHPEFRRKHLTTIRREVQRLQLLVAGVAVPPSPTLDHRWKNEYEAAEKWARSVRTIKTSGAGARDRLLRTTDLIIPQRH
jgi:hypothetical protein